MHREKKNGPTLDLLEVYAGEESRLTTQMNNLGGTARRFTKEDEHLTTTEGRKELA